MRLIACAALASLAASPSLAQAQAVKLEMIPFNVKAVPSIPAALPGKVVDGARWRDVSGEHVLILMQTGKQPAKGACALEGESCNDAEVHAHQYLVTGGKLTLETKLLDFERQCAFDLYAGFLAGSLSVTDLDGDGMAETSLAYKLACRSDASPARLKVVVREGKDKYVLRGTTRVEGMGGAAAPEPDPARWPPSFLRHAQGIWGKFVAPDLFEQF